MANRTIQFLGQGYAPPGTEPVVITATLDGNVVYTGTIPTVYTSVVDLAPEPRVVLFTCELPVDFAGTLPMSIALDGPLQASAFFQQIYSNYIAINNPVYSPSEIGVLSDPASTSAEKIAIYTAKALPPLSVAEIAILENGTSEEKTAVLISHHLTLQLSLGPNTFLNANGYPGNDPRSNVVINGVAQTRGTTPAGTWAWFVESPGEGTGLIEYDLTVVAGIE